MYNEKILFENADIRRKHNEWVSIIEAKAWDTINVFLKVVSQYPFCCKWIKFIVDFQNL